MMSNQGRERPFKIVLGNEINRGTDREIGEISTSRLRTVNDKSRSEVREIH